MATTTLYTINVTADEEAALEWLATADNTTPATLMQLRATQYLEQLLVDYTKAQMAQIQLKLQSADTDTIAKVKTYLGL